MDPEVMERLTRMQLADLGSRRREHISTVESRGPRAAMHLQDIEANRWTHQQGTAAQRLAAENVSQLDRWNKVHQTIGDTQDMERLDSLNSGQSHRANLTAAIRDLGSHDLERNKPGGKKKVPVARASVFNVGTKRKSGEPPDGGQHRARPPAPTRPANQGAPEGRRDNNSKRCSHKGKRAVSSTARPRRILGDFSQCISSPEEFLERARQIYTNQDSSSQTASVSNDDRSGSTSNAAVAPARTLPPVAPPATFPAATPAACPAAPQASPSVAPPAATQAALAPTAPVAATSSATKQTTGIKTGILLDFDAPLKLSPSRTYDEDLKGLSFQEPDPELPKRTPRRVYTIEELKRLEPKPKATKPKSQKPVTHKPGVSTGGLPKARTSNSVPSGSISMPMSSKPTVSGLESAKPQPVKSSPLMPGDPKANTSVHAAPRRDAPNSSTPKAPRLKPDAPAWEPPKTAAPKPNTATSESGKYPPPEARRTLSLIGDHLLPGRGGKKATGLEGSIYAS
ncbi:hypothetical protein BJX96DRAFT_178247 [Aspergillus floccosus]